MSLLRRVKCVENSTGREPPPSDCPAPKAFKGRYGLEQKGTVNCYQGGSPLIGVKTCKCG
jgi:hypothetical protein